MAASSPKDRLKQRLALRVAEENRLCEPLQPAAAAVSSTFSCDLAETKFIYVLRHADSFTTGVNVPWQSIVKQSGTCGDVHSCAIIKWMG